VPPQSMHGETGNSITSTRFSLIWYVPICSGPI
jgi:hypothetical protein